MYVCVLMYAVKYSSCKESQSKKFETYYGGHMLFFGCPTLELLFWYWGTHKCVNRDGGGVLSSSTEPKVGKVFCLSSSCSTEYELISKTGPIGCSHLKLCILRGKAERQGS